MLYGRVSNHLENIADAMMHLLDVPMPLTTLIIHPRVSLSNPPAASSMASDCSKLRSPGI